MGFVDVCRALGIDLPESPSIAPAHLADAGLLEDAVEDVRPWFPVLIDAWDRNLRVGGYPQAVAEVLKGPGLRGDLELRDALRDMSHGDVFAGSRRTSTQTQTTLRSHATSLGSLFSIQGLASAVHVAHATADARLHALRSAFLAFPAHRAEGLAPKPRSQAKWYLTDPRLARLVSGLGAGSPPGPGAVSEQQIGVVLRRALEVESPGAEIRHDTLLYSRFRTRAEIDSMSPAFRGAFVESRFVDRGWGRAFQTIEASGRKVGIVTTRSGTRKHEGGWALWAGLVAFLLGSQYRGRRRPSAFSASPSSASLPCSRP
jgi:hypothetical protein